MKFEELPFGVPCSAKDLKIVFCRVKSNEFADFQDRWSIFTIGEDEGYVTSILGNFDWPEDAGTVTNYLENVKDDFGTINEYGEIEMLIVCPRCGGTGADDSGGVTPSGDEISVPCECRVRP